MLKKIVLIFISIAACTALTLLHPSMSGATDLPVTDESGSLSGDATWLSGNIYLVQAGFTIPSGVTLTIEAGAIVKYVSVSWNTGIQVNGGTLEVDGTHASPVIFTSAADDSVGGDTNGDGLSSGNVGDYGGAIYMNNSFGAGTVHVSHAVFSYAGQGISASDSGWGYLTVSDSIFNHIARQAVYSVAGSLSLARNTFNLQDGNGFDAVEAPNVSDLSQVVLAGPDQNIFSGMRQGAKIAYLGGTVPPGTTWSVSTASGVILDPIGIKIDGTLNLPTNGVYQTTIGTAMIVDTGGTANVPAGSVLKLSADHYSTGVQVESGGTLNVNGTLSNPVTFTSSKDDSVGGDTNGDGYSAGSVGDYGDAILTRGGVLNIAHAVFEYATRGIGSVAGYYGGTINLSDSTFSHIDKQAVYQVNGNLAMVRNTFNLQDGTGYTAVEAPYVSDLSKLVLSGTDENNFIGTRINGTAVYVGGSVPSSSTWDISSASNALLEPNNIDVFGTLNLPNDVVYSPNLGVGITVENSAVLNMPAGSSFKVQADTSIHPAGVQVNSGGVLNANGTSSNPVRFTSSADDSIGGDTNSDGSTGGTSGDYGYAINNQGGTVTGTYLNIYYGVTAVVVNAGKVNLSNTTINHFTYGINDQSGLVAFRGTFSNIGSKAIVACDWGVANCSVDAAYTEWGSAANPYTGSDLICGQVFASPWVHSGLTYSEGSAIFESPNCDSTDALKASLQNGAGSLDSYLAQLGVDCTTIQSACDSATRVYTCIQNVTNTAKGALTMSIPAYTPGQTVVDYTGDVLGIVGNALSAGRSEVVGDVVGGLGDITGTLPVLSQLSNDYDSCLRV